MPASCFTAVGDCDRTKGELDNCIAVHDVDETEYNVNIVSNIITKGNLRTRRAMNERRLCDLGIHNIRKSCFDMIRKAKSNIL